jgi:hypothetical protein
MPAGKVPWGQLVSPMQVIYVVGVLGDRSDVCMCPYNPTRRDPVGGVSVPSGKQQACLKAVCKLSAAGAIDCIQQNPAAGCRCHRTLRRRSRGCCGRAGRRIPQRGPASRTSCPCSRSCRPNPALICDAVMLTSSVCWLQSSQQA